MRMAAKRFLNESGSDPDQPPEKRPRNRPSFASVIGEVVMVNSIQNFFSALEPMLRRVVNEEVERGLAHRSFRSITRSPSLRIQALEPSGFKLIFSKKISLPIFTGSKITDVENSPLQILLVDTRGGHMAPASLPHPIKVDIVVLDGDFPPGDRDNWTSEEFDSSIVKERTGKRPLLTGEVNITLRDGFAPTGDVEFTDNSSWIRSRKFRIGAKVVSGNTSGVRIREAITEAFVVKDHRGELYKKHHPPMLEDEVWRLEKIGKDGAFHRKLSSSGITTVQEFLKLSTVDPQKLRTILGNGMSEKMWEVTIKHARKCVMGNKLYLFRGPDFTIILNPICQVVRALINGHIYPTPTRDLPTINRTYIEKLVRDAYSNWYSLEELEGLPNEPALLTQGDMVDQYPNHHHHHHHHQSMAMKSIQQSGYPIDHKSAEVGCSDWQINSNTYLSTISIEHGIGGYSISESSSDGELTPSRSFINGN
ncbi:hypothetical protein Dsin_005153 [Dipteronia sinensis]|uniref:Protein SAR DEFICIENT 1 n=1 Tax=Dipteronia sinensis TaxID=43782 RepID=A0AAE0EEF3_9ROSI|nr:hypothetical protein Dsin_005153 [Dipteronia sinensis]